MGPSTGDQDFEDDQFTVQQVDHLQVPRLSLKASKSLPYSSPPNLSKITPYEPPKSEKLRHRPELLQVEFAEGNNDGPTDIEQDEETQQSTASTSPTKQPPKKNMKFKQLLARFQISPRPSETAKDDPLDWLESPEVVVGKKSGGVGLRVSRSGRHC
eukprot:Protomagalhaensia_wolfi_Nauph_80__5836@NODE_738_length_2050_cov_44_854301_g552_i0_p2_GENE_NODE_738_length_2050_cov_44_854301_g552_i0NODE_738_length_2050_cov_44_854301_g552_i0_p2_ORF_typecomplete_len157_score30_79ATAD4/PF15321_6/0_016_NODE_738_length_2050_cov_44_854301_g552_i08001270